MRETNHLTLRGLRKYLREEGVRVSARQINFAIESGHLEEPARTTSDQRIWMPSEAAMALEYFRHRGLKTQQGKG